MPAPVMKLIFIEDGQQLGSVTVIDGELVGKTVFKKIVENRMNRDQVDAEAAVRSLNGWGNGYLSAVMEITE